MERHENRMGFAAVGRQLAELLLGANMDARYRTDKRARGASGQDTEENPGGELHRAGGALIVER